MLSFKVQKHNELCYRLNLTFDFALALRQSHLVRDKYSLGEGCAALVEYSWTRACHNALVVCAGTRFGPEFGVGPWNGNPQALVGARWLCQVDHRTASRKLLELQFPRSTTDGMRIASWRRKRLRWWLFLSRMRRQAMAGCPVLYSDVQKPVFPGSLLEDLARRSCPNRRRSQARLVA